MLDDLRAEDSIEYAFGPLCKIGEEVRRLRFEPLMPAQSDGLAAEIDPSRWNPGIAHDFEKFSAAAADIEHISTPREIRQIDLLSCFDVVLRTAKALRETPVVEWNRRA